MLRNSTIATPPYTQAVRRALQIARDSRIEADLLFLEAWEMQRPRDLGLTLRASQIRRANRELADAITAELKAS